MSDRRMGNENSKSREILLDAAEQLMREDGYASVSSRKVAEKAGLKPQLVHYYFKTMDDLFLALFERLTDVFLVQFARALSSDKPLHALWVISSNQDGAALMTEFLALANHRKALRAEITRVNRRMRSMQAEVFKQILQRAGFDLEKYPPATMAVALESIARGIAMESALGITQNHEAMHSFILGFLSRFEPDTGK